MDHYGWLRAEIIPTVENRRCNLRVLLFADYMTRGEHTYTYLARAKTPGTFLNPPAKAELMYQPEINGNTGTGSVVVREGVGVASR